MAFCASMQCACVLSPGGLGLYVRDYTGPLSVCVSNPYLSSPLQTNTEEDDKSAEQEK